MTVILFIIANFFLPFVLLGNNDIKLEDNDVNVSNQINQLSESELIGRLCAQRLLLEIHYGGVMDTTFQHLPFLFMAAAEDHEPCKVRGDLINHSSYS